MVLMVIMVTFWMTLLVNKWTNIVTDDERVHPLAKTLPPLVNNLWWNIVMDAWNLDENHLASDNNYNIVENLQEMTNNVGLAYSVGDTILRFTLSIEQDN